MNENFYLELLNEQTRELELIIKNKKNYAPNVYNCILAGIVIRMNSVLEQCMLDFHSPNFSEVSKMIYNSRQLLVHYYDYRTFSNLEEIFLKIIDKFKRAYPNERYYFKKILSYKATKEHNVVVSKDKNIIYDEFTNSYIFKGDNVEISVSRDKVIKIQDLKKRRDIAYIVNCDSDMNYFYRGEDNETFYKELSGYGELQTFFMKHFNVVDIDYQKHKDCIKDILDTFYHKGNYTSVFVEEKLDESSRRNPLYIETAVALDKFFNDDIVYEQFLDGRVYTNKGIPNNEYFDYKSIRENCKMDLENNISKRDYFFITKTISIFANLNSEVIKSTNLTDGEREKMEISMLINWIDHSLRNFTLEFVEANEEFNKLHNKLIYYRNFYAHNILQTKTNTSKRILEEFYELSKEYVMILNSLNIKTITKPEEENIVNFVAIERMPYHFVNHKYEQYIQVDPSTYIGDKLYYSTRGSEYNKIIGLVGVDKSFPIRGTYYENKNGEFIAKTFKTKSGKKHNLLVSKLDYSKGQDCCLDVNLDDLLYIYAAYKGKISKELTDSLERVNHKKVVIFRASKENNFTSHASELDEIISGFYQQRFLPFELVKKTKINLVKESNGKGYFQILDENDNEIAIVVDSKRLKDYDIVIDKKGYFTIHDTTHNFDKRRR